MLLYFKLLRILPRPLKVPTMLELRLKTVVRLYRMLSAVLVKWMKPPSHFGRAAFWGVYDLLTTTKK